MAISDDDTLDLPPELRFLSGEFMGVAMQRFPWNGTPLGDPTGWPQPLKTLVGMMLAAEQPMFVAWGPQRTLLYNNSYAPMLADRHPAALGRPFFAVWPEVKDELTPLFDRVSCGEPIHMADIELQLDRPGHSRESHFAFSYTPVRDEAGVIVGLFCPCTETTDQILSERRRAAEAERQRVLLQQIPGFVGVLNGPDHTYEYVNDAYIAISGARTFIGRPVREVFPELKGQGFYELLDQVYATGQPFTARALPISLAGEAQSRFIDLLYQPIRADGGQVTGIFVGGYDITERVRAEQRREALLRLDEKLRDLNDTAELSFASSKLLGETLGVVRVGYGSVDPDAKTITVERNWNAPGHGSVAGTHQFQDYGVHIDNLSCGEVVANADVRLDARTVGKTASFDALGIAAFLDVPIIEQGRITSDIFVHSAVPRVWTEDEIAFVKDVADRTRAAIARREAEKHSRISEARLANALASAKLGTFEWDPKNGRVDMDERARSIFAFPRSAPIHQDEVFGRISGDQAAAIKEGAITAAERGERMAFEYDIDLPDRSVRFIRSSCIAAHTPGGIRFVGVFQDATELKSAERALRLMNETLEERVRGRTVELETAHEQLRQSQKMEAVGQLTGGLAHDFNNLLAGISGSLELIRMRLAQGRTAEVDKYVTAAQGAANRAASLTHRLLAFSRRQTLAPKPTDVKQLISGMVDLIGRSVGPQIRLELVNGVGLWPSLIDPSQLENAVLNLCINARDAMPDSGTITIETANRWLDHRMGRERGVEPGQYISLCVSDTGTGMTPDVIAKAFDPFFTTKPIGVGTGLGLSMIYGFAKQSGGAVSIYSEPGKGTNVCIYLPRHVGDAKAEDVSPLGLANPPRGDGETVLIVDDEPTLRMLVSEVLADLGYTAIEAEDGAAGLKILDSSTRIDLLVSDVGLPGGMNGRQLADAARRSRPALKVLFITGYAENAVLSHGHLDPGMHVMTKPFAMEALAGRIRELIADGFNPGGA